MSSKFRLSADTLNNFFDILRYVAEKLSQEGVTCIGDQTYDDWDDVVASLYKACLIGEFEEDIAMDFSGKLGRKKDLLRRLGYVYPKGWRTVALIVETKDEDRRAVRDVIIDECFQPYFLCNNGSRIYRRNFGDVNSFHVGLDEE